MKHTLSLFACALLFAACKETGPAIDFGPKAKDTSFIAAPETPQQRTVVIEEFTGVTCTNCPAGHAIIKAIEDANPNRVAAVGIQAFNVKQAEPVKAADAGFPTLHDNRTQVGTELANEIYGSFSGIPVAGIDRISVSGNMLYDRASWSGTVTSRLGIAPAANVTISSIYNTSTKQAAITVHVAYTSAMAKRQKLTVALVENNIVDAQEGIGTNGYEQNYVHQHVLRDILTAPSGSAILTDKSTKQPGQVYERTFVYNVNPDWNPDYCRVVAYVSDDEGADLEIVQGAIKSLK
jgi:hypothetical protein